MAVMGSNGTNKTSTNTNSNSNQENALQNRLNQNRNFNIVKETKTSQNDLTKASDLHKNNEVAKPKDTNKGANPIKRALQKRNSKNDIAKPKRKSLLKKDDASDDSSSSTEQENNEEVVESEGQETVDNIGKGILKFLVRHPMVLFGIIIGVLLFFFIFIVIFAVSSIFGGNPNFGVGFEEQSQIYGDFFSFENTEIYILNENGTSPIGSRTVSLREYIMGIVYIDTKDINLDGLTTQQIEDFYTSVILVKKAQVLKKGKYNNMTKSISLKVSDFNYCDAYYGCKLVSKNGQEFYIANSIDYKTGSVIKSYDKMSDDKIVILYQAYKNSLSKIIAPDEVEEPLTEYKWDVPKISTAIYNSWVELAKKGKTYEGMINDAYPTYQVYNLGDYAMKFETTYLSEFSYWWPIGSDEADSFGLYSGDPASNIITSSYGPSFETQTINKGIVIGGTCEETNAVSIADGVVTNAGNSSNYGKYVVVSHDNNIKSLYAHLSTINVRQGLKIKAGELIGKVGEVEEDECGLYFEMTKNGAVVNPMDYVSIDNPRVSSARYIKFVQGENNQQTVCKTLLASGFSRPAVAGIMANIKNESGFKLNDLSDGGTSNGLFQWHKGRLTNLQNYCGAEYLTSIKCQLDFFLYEITSSPNAENGVYNYLMGTHSAYDMGYEFCMKFERPSRAERAADERGRLAESTYVPYVNNGCR